MFQGTGSPNSTANCTSVCCYCAQQQQPLVQFAALFGLHHVPLVMTNTIIIYCLIFVKCHHVCFIAMTNASLLQPPKQQQKGSAKGGSSKKPDKGTSGGKAKKKVRNLLMGRDGIPIRRPDSQSREPIFKSHCGRFEPLARLITPRCHSSLSCINEYLVIQTVMDM